MIVYITRHGQVDGAGDHPVGYKPISPLGRRQAERLGERLRSLGFRGPVFVSPYHRCLETADIICRVTQTTFIPEPHLGEIAGTWIHEFAGYRAEEIAANFPRCASGVSMPWPWWPREMERLEDVVARLAPFVKRLRLRSDDAVLLVGHGASAGAAAYLLGGVAIDHYNATLTAIELPSGRVLLANDTEHLGPGEVTSNRRVVA